MINPIEEARKICEMVGFPLWSEWRDWLLTTCSTWKNVNTDCLFILFLTSLHVSQTTRIRDDCWISFSSTWIWRQKLVSIKFVLELLLVFSSGINQGATCYIVEIHFCHHSHVNFHDTQEHSPWSITIFIHIFLPFMRLSTELAKCFTSKFTLESIDHYQ